MHKTFFLIIVIVGASMAFIGYGTIVIDWFQQYSTGTYRYNRFEAMIELGALLLYTYFGVRFFNRHVGSLR